MVTQNLRGFAYIARRYNSAAESTSLLSLVVSLVINDLNMMKFVIVPQYGRPTKLGTKLHNFNCVLRARRDDYLCVAHVRDCSILCVRDNFIYKVYDS